MRIIKIFKFKLMKCPHCSIAVKFNWKVTDPQQLSQDQTEGMEIIYSDCPSCNLVVVALQQGKLESSYLGLSIEDVNWRKIIYPKSSDFDNHDYIPPQYLEDYEESLIVISASPKASAALSRRLLQNILREQFKIHNHSLAKEIEVFTQLQGIPSHITDAVDAVRQIGNIAAHPIKDKNTGEIVPVEIGEAEWLINVIEALFDFVFIQPIKLQKRKEELNIKLKKIGKQQMK